MRVLPESKWARRAAYAALAVVLLAVSGVIVWRVLAPAEVVTEAMTAYPPVEETTPGPVGALISAPLIVDGRIRVYADKRQIRSDDEPAYKYEKSPFWSFRRWPEQLVGLVHPQTAASGVPVIVGSWTDGELVALDGRSGAVLWRAQGETLGDGYDGRRTGSSVVWTPQGLFTGVGDQPVVVTVGDQTVSAYAAADGKQLWRAETPACLEQAFTAKGALLAPDTCVGPHSLIRFDLNTGERREQPFQKGFNDRLTGHAARLPGRAFRVRWRTHAAAAESHGRMDADFGRLRRFGRAGLGDRLAGRRHRHRLAAGRDVWDTRCGGPECDHR